MHMNMFASLHLHTVLFEYVRSYGQPSKGNISKVEYFR